MKVLTLHQPWASLIAWGIKTIETRPWQTSYRGDLAIHAARAFQPYAQDVCLRQGAIRLALLERARMTGLRARHGATWHLSRAMLDKMLPRGVIVATSSLVDVIRTEEIFIGGRALRTYEAELPFGNYAPKRFAWMLGDVRAVHPVPATGQQGLWELSPVVADSLRPLS